MRTKFMTSLESEEVVEVAQEVPAEEIMETSADAEVAHDEVISETGSVEELQEAIQEGVEGSDELVALGGTVEAAVDSGEGMDEKTAEVVEIAVEGIKTRLGMSKDKKITPSLENFKGQRTRIEATRISLEGFKDTIKAIWEKIISIAKAIWEKIKAFVGNLTKNYKAIEASLESLKKKVEGVQSEEMKSKELEKAALAKFFSIGGKAGAETAQETLATASKFTAFSDKVLAAASAVNLESEGDAARVGQVIVAAIKGAGLPEKTEGENVLIGPLPGAQFFKIGPAKDGGISFETEADKNPATKIAALSKAEAITLIEAAIAEAKKGPNLKKVADSAEKVLKLSIAHGEKIMKEVVKLRDEKGDAATYKAASRAATATTKIAGKLAGTIPALHFQTVKHVGDYVSASITNFGVAKKEEAKAA